MPCSKLTINIAQLIKYVHLAVINRSKLAIQVKSMYQNVSEYSVVLYVGRICWVGFWDEANCYTSHSRWDRHTCEARISGHQLQIRSRCWKLTTKRWFQNHYEISVWCYDRWFVWLFIKYSDAPSKVLNTLIRNEVIQHFGSHSVTCVH